jgi:maleate isomerase
MTRQVRIGMVVPSSNVTMETEVPELLRRREQVLPERFTFHSARVRMNRVERSELAAMNDQGADAASALADADCDVIAYACLVAAMVDPRGRETIEADLRAAAKRPDRTTPVLTSAGALIEAIQHLGAKTVAVVAPYKPELTQVVIEQFDANGIAVCDSVSLAVDDNRQVAMLPPEQLPGLARDLDRTEAQAVVLSACVQMPSLPSIAAAESELGVPVLSAATATTWKILRSLDLPCRITDGGSLLRD